MADNNMIDNAENSSIDVAVPGVDLDNNQTELFEDGANVQQDNNNQQKKEEKKKDEKPKKKKPKKKLKLSKKTFKYVIGSMAVVGALSYAAGNIVPNILQKMEEKRIEENNKNGNMIDYFKTDTLKLYDPEQTSFDEILEKNSDINKEFERLNKLSVVGKKIELLKLDHDLVDNNRYEFLYSDLDVDKLNNLYDLYFQYKNTRESQDPACKEYGEFQEICKILDGSQKAIDLYAKTTGMDVLRDYTALVYEAEIVDSYGYDYNKIDNVNLNSSTGKINFEYDGQNYDNFYANPEVTSYLNGDNPVAAIQSVKEEIDYGKGFYDSSANGVSEYYKHK